jgi:hypothetical protein
VEYNKEGLVFVREHRTNFVSILEKLTKNSVENGRGKKEEDIQRRQQKNKGQPLFYKK